MFDKLEDLLVRFEEVLNELGEPGVTDNQERFQKLMKEQSELQPIVDTYKEYKENKALVQNEKQLLEKQLAELPAQDSESDQAESALLDRVKNVYEIVNSESVDDVTKNEILKSIIEKIVYNKEKDTLEVYYYYKPQTQ